MENTLLTNPINNSIAFEVMKIALVVHEHMPYETNYEAVWNFATSIYEDWVSECSVETELENTCSEVYADRIMREECEEQETSPDDGCSSNDRDIIRIVNLVRYLERDDVSMMSKLQEIKLARDNKLITPNEAIDLALEYPSARF